MLEVETFNDIIKYFENFILTTFNKKEKSVKGFSLKCFSTDISYLLSLNIDRGIKLKQLKTMYLNENEIEKVKKELKNLDNIQVVYNFNLVGGKDISTHHKKGGCLKEIIFMPLKDNQLKIDINFRASVAPYNLYYDLIMLHNLFKKLEVDNINKSKCYYFNFDEIKGKLMQNFFYYISSGYYDNPENLLKYEYGQMMLNEYNKAENASYHSTKRFWGKCNDAMERRKLENGK